MTDIDQTYGLNQQSKSFAQFQNIFDGKVRCSSTVVPNLKTVLEKPDPYVPKEHPEYVFDKGMLRDIVGFLLKPNNDELSPLCETEF